MVQLPWELRLSLRTGTVYKMQHRDLTSSLPHFLVVLNPDPQSSTLIVLGVFSSKVDETKYRRQGEPNETVIEISPDEYKELTKESVIDCNSIKNISLNELIHKFENKFLVGCDDLSEELVKKIICGVHKSRHVSNKIKQLLK